VTALAAAGQVSAAGAATPAATSPARIGADAAESVTGPVGVSPGVTGVGVAAPGVASPGIATAKAAPALRTRVVMRNLDIPWDIAVLPRGDWLVTERDRERILLRRPSGAVRVLASSPNEFWHGGETGLMSVAADPLVRRNGRFYTCTGYSSGGRLDVRVIAWRINPAHTRAHRVGTLLSGIQVTSGRHGGCRIRFGDRAMYVGTGDAAVHTNPQNLRSLNGKVLRLNRFTGRPVRDNPFINADNRKKRFVFSYGHRNVQGLAWRRGGGGMWSAEHGPSRDDEVNRLRRGGNYGWDPGPGYDESTPMTEFSLPGKQIGARWRSGFPTLATSGITWVHGPRWGAYNGALAVCALKASRLVFMKFNARGRLMWVRTPAALNGDFGRLRSVTQGPTGALLVTTANGGGDDRVVKVTPR
jgi:glucose/arabinose dehydrogenase